IKERVHLPGFFHDTLGERDRAPALARIRSFIQARFAEPLRELSRRDAHRHGPTFEESEILAWPPERNSLADLRWRVVRGGLRFGGT
ncbi:class I SAM-dependent methyltransferase family protein, partial [Mycobacterium tuberculosis]|nr:class I SAM-dependent methyltransferase family protein [Mycobacterium tuberculosis]